MAKHQQENHVQNFPSPDSLPTEPFESVVELYYQTQGYITSSNKWFPLNGSQDIDVLALNGNETLIISVTVNLDDKIRCKRNGDIRNDMKETLCDSFKQVIAYLNKVDDYRWLCQKPRMIRRILAYSEGYKKDSKDKQCVEKALSKRKIELISSNEIIKGLTEYVRQTQEGWSGKNLKTNNPLVMLVRLLLKWLEEEENKCDRTVNRRIENAQ